MKVLLASVWFASLLSVTDAQEATTVSVNATNSSTVATNDTVTVAGTPPPASVSVEVNATEVNATDATELNATDNTTAAENATIYDGCDMTDYYATLTGDVSTWTFAQVEALITATHLNQLPSITGSENSLTALVDLDPGPTNPEDTVLLYDRNIEFDAASQNTPEGWKRGDLWPLLRGAGLDTKAGTDVHAKRPVDWEVDSELQDLFWGECGTVEADTVCQRPAVANQTDATTATDQKIKTPSESMRGAIARSVLYAALRYATELGLNVTDCPPFRKTDYGYRSALVQWHLDHPVTDAEITRNDRACRRWQGNRNPLVDYPDLVTQFFGTPDDVLEGTFLYAQCAAATVATESPTATPNECSSLVPGDVSILIFNSDPIDQIVLFPVVDLAPSLGSLYITDRAWNGTDFCPTDEGTLEYTIPAEGTKAGKVFGYKVEFPDDKGNWSEVEGEGNGLFDLSTLQGDNMFVYCLNADGQPHFLSALVYNDAGFGVGSGAVAPAPTPATNETGAVTTALELPTCDVTTTLLPEDLAAPGTKGVLALPFSPNYLYEGIRDGNKVELLAAFADPANYKGNVVPYNILTSHASMTMTSWAVAVSLVAGLVTLL